MDREKIPRIIAGTDTFVTDPEDDGQDCARPCCREVDIPTHWGQWLRPD